MPTAFSPSLFVFLSRSLSKQFFLVKKFSKHKNTQQKNVFLIFFCFLHLFLFYIFLFEHFLLYKLHSENLYEFLAKLYKFDDNIIFNFSLLLFVVVYLRFFQHIVRAQEKKIMQKFKHSKKICEKQDGILQFFRKIFFLYISAYFFSIFEYFFRSARVAFFFNFKICFLILLFVFNFYYVRFERPSKGCGRRGRVAEKFPKKICKGFLEMFAKFLGILKKFLN